MQAKEWSTIITKIVPLAAESIDDLLEEHDHRCLKSGECSCPDTKLYMHPRMKNLAQASIGVRVSDDINAADLAMKLAAMAIEKEVFPVIFTRSDYAGLERFGFRIEKVSGKTPEECEACEEQLKTFWDISVMI